jgi:hypothetical protein
MTETTENRASVRESLESLIRDTCLDTRTVEALISAADAYAASEVTAALEIGQRIEKAHGEGQWKVITFFGHTEYTGWVTEITQHGQAAYRVDLPEKIWGGNPLACHTHAASSWFSDHPVTEESVRAAWVARQERARLRAEQEAEWLRSQSQEQVRALEAGDDDEYAGEPF